MSEVQHIETAVGEDNFLPMPFKVIPPEKIARHNLSFNI
jgi:hypothetical protein